MWVGPLAFLVHDAEEVLTIEPWLRRHGSELPAAVRPLFAELGARQFAGAVLVLFAGYVAASAHGTWAVRRGRRPWPFLVAAGALVANGVTHLLQALAFRGYTPGVVTALLVSLPYGWLAGRALLRDGVASRAMLRAAAAAGLVLQVPLAFLALGVGRELGAR